MIRAAVFDMDGILIDSEPFWRDAEIEVFKTVGVELTGELCRETTGLRMDAAVQHWFDRTPWTNKPREQVEREVKERVVELIALHAQPLPGVDEIFGFFERRGLPIALCSSSPYPVIEAIVRKLSLSDRLRVLYSAEDEPFGKPHPGAYMTSAQRLGVAPQQCIAFEDSMNGLISAKSARMSVVAVPEPAHFERTIFDFCDAKIPSLLDFSDDLFDRLCAARR